MAILANAPARRQAARAQYDGLDAQLDNALAQLTRSTDERDKRHAWSKLLFLLRSRPAGEIERLEADRLRRARQS